MSTCLNEARIRAAADNEAGAAERAHLDTCEACRARVEAARRAADELVAMAAAVAPPASLSHGVHGSILRSRQAAGATTLRGAAPSLRGAAPRRSFSRVWVTAGAVAAVVLVIMFALPPFDAPRTISAAEILDRSLQTLASGGGVELRQFELALQLPRVAAAQNGTYRIEQLVDHDTPGRFKIVRYAPDGSLLEAISEDPAAGTRTVAVSVDGQLFTFQLAMRAGRMPSLVEVERQHVEALIRLLQAAAGPTLREIEDGNGKRYVVELPAIASKSTSGLWDLTHARVTIDAADFQILELTAAGSYMGDPFSVTFRLERREVWSSGEVPADRFAVPAAGAITIEGVATEDLGRDLLAGALRALARSR